MEQAIRLSEMEVRADGDTPRKVVKKKQFSPTEKGKAYVNKSKKRKTSVTAAPEFSMHADPTNFMISQRFSPQNKEPLNICLEVSDKR